MTLALRYAVRSDVGLLREGNEDSAYAGPRLLAIADGMGGHAAGEVASAIAISTLAKLADNVPDDLLGALAAAVATANKTLHDMSAADRSVEGMGTTLTAMLWSGSRLALCHIGDSRAYLLRGGEFSQITRDHTLVQALVDDGRISPDEAATHPQRSLLLRALDGSVDAEPDLSMREALAGDRYLLCSDGLSDVVSEQTLHRTLATTAEPDDAVLRLIELAIKGGGPDNITCIVADVMDSATNHLTPSETSHLVGAASASAAAPLLRTDSPAGRAHVLTQTTPQAAVMLAHDDPVPRAAPRAGAEQDGRPRRRLPIVKSLIAVLVIVVAGGVYAGWRYTQDQYYVGTSNGEVVIFQGINEEVAGMHLSHVVRRTGIPLAQVPTTYLGSIEKTIPANGLAGAERTVGYIRSGYQQCMRARALLSTYQKKLSAYQTKLKAYEKKFKTATPVTIKGKHYTPPVPPQQPPPLPSECPAKAGAAQGAPVSGSGGTP